ncbi:MAG TPA: hypothetical protein VF881_14755 [Polyangiaceae bacterium]
MPLPGPQDAYPRPIRGTVDSIDVVTLEEEEDEDRRTSASEPPWDPPLPRPVPIDPLRRPEFAVRAPAYDTPSGQVAPARGRSSHGRSLWAKLLFVLILGAVVALLCYEIAIVFHVAWLDPRPLLTKLLVLREKLPWLLPK